MTDAKPESPDAVEADGMGERPDRGRTTDALREALTGSGVGSDTRAGSLQGGAATGSDDDPDQAAVDRIMADQGRASADPRSPSGVDPTGITNTGVGPGEADAGPADGGRPTDADADRLTALLPPHR
ncbi:ribonuclease [Brevundimonas sp.]|uniref:ribonuclease n=1 Tax=Brevundimonas sp. TaxID=1871086 RepID=UPI00286A6C9F|nr:ribonuclease [Brevundimonas sp.]